MPENLGSLMGISKTAGPGTTGPGAPVPGSMPGASPGGAGLGGQISNMMKTMPASGIRGLTGSVASMVIKVLQGIAIAYDIESPEGKAIGGAIRSLAKVSKGQQTGDMKSIVQSLIAALPPNMQNVNPGSISSAIQELVGKQGGAAMPGAPAVPPGPPGGAAPPPPGPMGTLMR